MTKTTEQYKSELKTKNKKVLCISEYNKSNIKIEHSCIKCGNKWYAQPKNILRGTACPVCKRTDETKSTNKYINDLLTINNNITSIATYINATTKILHQCDKCNHIWKVSPNSVLRGNGCPKCSTIKRSKTLEQYNNELKNKSTNIKCLEPYIGYNIKILHVCKTCNHSWRTTPSHTLRDGGCPNCYRITRTKTNTDYVNELNTKYPTILNVNEYVNAITKIPHKCKTCNHEWDASPNDILSGRGCIKCSGKTYSKIAIEWINSINPNIRHAENGGEYIIPTTRYKVDGYDANTNTVYEFLGDCWHGNPDIYEKSIRCHPFSDKTAKELYDDTILRINTIKTLGYNVVYVWEHEYRLNRRK